MTHSKWEEGALTVPSDAFAVRKVAQYETEGASRHHMNRQNTVFSRTFRGTKRNERRVDAQATFRAVMRPIKATAAPTNSPLASSLPIQAFYIDGKT